MDNTDTKHTNFTFLAGLVGCSDLDAAAELSCVRKVPAQTLENALSYYSGNGTEPSLSFVPAVDNKTAFANWTQQALDGKIAKIVRAHQSFLPGYYEPLILTWIPSLAPPHRQQYQRRRRLRLFHRRRTRRRDTIQPHRIHHRLSRRSRSQESQHGRPRHVPIPIRRQFLECVSPTLVRSLPQR